LILKNFQNHVDFVEEVGWNEMFDMNSQNLEGLWRVEGLKEGSVAHRSGVLFQGDLIKSIQEWEVTGQGWESFGCVYANLFVRVYVHT